MDMQILQQINHWAACARLTSECSSVIHADLLEKAADHITSIESQLETARKRITELENAALVPGALHCAKCNFQLSKTNLYMKSGTTGPGDNKTEPCPNGCGPLWPVTWRQRTFDASAAADKYFDELKAAEARVLVPSDETLREVIRAWNRADIPQNAYPEMRKALGYLVEGGEAVTIAPAPAGVIMRPPFEKPLERCAAARDGECFHKDCPQLRDNEPTATGRHCPIDNWGDY